MILEPTLNPVLCTKESPTVSPVLCKFDKPVLYTDADMYPLQYLHLFDQVYYDCMVLNWNTDIETIREDITAIDICYNDLVLNTSGGTMWWSNSLQSKNTLKIWDLINYIYRT